MASEALSGRLDSDLLLQLCAGEAFEELLHDFFDFLAAFVQIAGVVGQFGIGQKQRGHFARFAAIEGRRQGLRRLLGALVVGFCRSGFYCGLLGLLFRFRGGGFAGRGNILRPNGGYAQARREHQGDSSQSFFQHGKIS